MKQAFSRDAGVEGDHWWSRSMWRIASGWLGDAIRGRRGLLALDVGCGSGTTLGRLAGMAEVGQVVGLDRDLKALQEARWRGSDRLVQGTALALPFASASFDVVTCFDVEQHWADDGDGAAMAELGRILRPEGVVLLRANASKGRASFRLEEMVAIVDRTGLRVDRASYVNGLPALAQEIRGRWAPGSRLRDRSAWLPHPSGGGLRIDVPELSLPARRGRLERVEDWATTTLGKTLPFGHSTMILARRARTGGECDR